MSVAFRRESDEEHKEPRFELPLPPGPNLVTRRGLALIEAKVAELEAATADPLADGADADAIAAREDLLRSLRYWRTRLATAQLMASPPEGSVAFGTRFVIRLKGRQRTIDIVGGDEAEPTENRIAFFAPLARAVIGADEGDRVDFGGEAEAIEILSAEAIPEA